MSDMQKQQMLEKQLNTKLDRITKMLGAVLERMDESEPDRRLIKRIVKEWKGINSGRTKIQHYKNLAEFERAVS